jgi:hypothetical protein
MNHIVVSDKNYRLYAGTLEACKEFAKDWAIKNKRSPKIVTERAFVETRARQAGENAQQLVLTAVAEHQVDGAVITKAVNTLIESGQYGWSNVLKKAQKNQPLSASQIGWIIREAAKVSKARKVAKTLASAVA